MLRIKRSVQATYNTQVNFMASQMLKVYSNATGTGELWSLRWRSADGEMQIPPPVQLCPFSASVPTPIHVCLLVPVSDLAPGQSGMDDMKLLEQRAEQLAAEAERDQPRAKEKILFVRYGWYRPK